MKFTPLPDGMREPCATAGRLIDITYPTQTYDSDHRPLTKRALVYLPFGYDEQTEQRYPVLYFMHGGGGDENEAFGGLEARTALKNVLDNAIAEKHVQPLIVVAPTYTVEGFEAARRSIDVASMLTHRFPTELANDLIPAVDSTFRTLPDRWHRAFSGFSMGGETTWSVLADAARDVWCVAPLSGDYWAIALKGGKDFPEETADALLARLHEAGIAPQDCRVMAFTGDKDIAYEALEPMVQALARRTDFFTLADSPVGGNLTWCLKENGWHTYDDCWEYLWLTLPHLFAEA